MLKNNWLKRVFIALIFWGMAPCAHAVELRAMVVPTEMLPAQPATNISQIPFFSNPAGYSHRRFGFYTEPSNLPIGFTSLKYVTVLIFDLSTGGIYLNINSSITQARPEPNTTSGGHEHNNSSRPVGSFDTLSGNTGPSGYGFTTIYTAPEASGNLEFTVKCDICPVDEINYLHVEVPGLASLQPAAQYNLVGSTATHPDNHYGTPSFVTKLAALGALYNLKYINQTGNQLEFNDISLVTGGLFDISGGWASPHIEHRNGISGDLRLVPVSRQEKLREFMAAVGITGTTLVHGAPAPHWHIRESGTNQ